jgi:uncharacterized protein
VVNNLPKLPALVTGEVTHRRTGPVRHAFRHRVYQWLVDLDAIPVQPRHLRALGTFPTADHLGDPGLTIKENVERYLGGNNIRLGEGGRILMLANARVFGHAFNPLTVFWCFAEDGTLACVVAEVHNTYGERHAYLLRPDATGSARTDKTFYVSPFFDVSGSYTLRFTLRPHLVSTSVTLHQGRRVAFSATFRGSPRPASRSAIIAQALWQPFMPHRVSALIRMHGVWLWLRGLPVVPRPRHTPQDAP